ncbi:MAG: carboxylesterase [Rhodobacterales bacterium 34-62-10]|nr:MAG: carboxylesterase [Rhodobacterales bacterium 34-62-10]
MALIDTVLTAVFGGGRNVLRETAEVFRANAEEDAARDAALRQAALTQFGAEFTLARQGWFDRMVDAANRLPRPLMALGTLGLFVSAMVDPVWFASRMQGIALVPEPLWWLLGAIVSFYFGARHQAKGQEFQVRVAQTMAQVPRVVDNIKALRALDAGQAAAVETSVATAPGPDAPDAADNPALADWRRGSATPHSDPVGGR